MHLICACALGAYVCVCDSLCGIFVYVLGVYVCVMYVWCQVCLCACMMCMSGCVYRRDAQEDKETDMTEKRKKDGW